ncbi:MAG: DUF4190 domain-containing protein [Nocardioides sp.]
MSYPPGPPQPGEPHPGSYPAPAPTNGNATSSLIVGITTLVLSWCCGFGVLGLVAVVLGMKGRSEIRRSGGAQGGEGIALAGVITGAIAVLVGLLVLIAVIGVIAGGNAAFQDYTEYPG